MRFWREIAPNFRHFRLNKGSIRHIQGRNSCVLVALRRSVRFSFDCWPPPSPRPPNDGNGRSLVTKSGTCEPTASFLADGCRWQDHRGPLLTLPAHHRQRWTSVKFRSMVLANVQLAQTTGSGTWN